jgi:hypothetical protein
MEKQHGTISGCHLQIRPLDTGIIYAYTYVHTRPGSARSLPSNAQGMHGQDEGSCICGLPCSEDTAHLENAAGDRAKLACDLQLYAVGRGLVPGTSPLSNKLCFNALMRRDTATVGGAGGPAMINPLALLAGVCTWPCASASPPSGRPSRSSARIYTRCTPSVCGPAGSPRCFRTTHMNRLHTPHGDWGWRLCGSFHSRATRGPGTPTPAPHQGGHVILTLFPAQWHVMLPLLPAHWPTCSALMAEHWRYRGWRGLAARHLQSRFVGPAQGLGMEWRLTVHDVWIASPAYNLPSVQGRQIVFKPVRE